MVQEIVRRARRRLVGHRWLAQFAVAGALVMGGVLLLLITGSRIFDWRFPAALGAAGLLFGVWRASRHVPSLYESAVQVDQGAGLHDAISTAFHFSGIEAGPVHEAQRRQAAAVSKSVDLSQALPLAMPRAMYVMAALLLACSALFALRFGLLRRMDLQPGLARILIDSFGPAQAAQPAPAPTKQDGLLASVGIHLPENFNAPVSKEGGPESLSEKANATTNASTPRPPALALNGKDKGGAKEGNAKADDSERGDPHQPGSKPGDSAENGKPGEGKQGQPGKSAAPSGDNSSLMARMKDAMSSLMAKAKEAATGQQNGGKAADKKNVPQPSQASEKGRDGQGQQGGQESSQAQQAGQPGKPGETKNGASDGKSSESQQAAQAGSGMGSQNGSKELKAAQQMEAMGKLSAIIGKRSQNVTGEMRLDTQSGQQSLRTAYTRNTAGHADAGGDVSRDQVPVAVQSYVQQYFQEVRRSRAPRAPVSK